jgi:uncharacterized protein YigA (DUF484 family)
MSEQGASPRELVAENESLRARMAYLLEQAERNHAIMCRHQAFDLEIVGAGSFPELIGTIFRSLPVISELDVVTLCLVDPEQDIHTVMLKLGIDFADFPQLVFVDSDSALGFVPSRRAQLTARRNRCLGRMCRPCTRACSRSRRPGCKASRWCRCCATSASSAA